MTTKGKIKVIKKGESVKTQVTETPIKAVKKSKEAAREMVSTVTNWVTEFQRNKREETKLAFEQLFSGQPQVN